MRVTRFSALAMAAVMTAQIATAQAVVIAAFRPSANSWGEEAWVPGSTRPASPWVTSRSGRTMKNTIDQTTGQLTLIGYATEGIDFPRNFAIDPTGRFLIAANQNSSNLVTFRIDRDTGALTPAGSGVEVPSPVSIVFARPSP